MRPHRAVVIAHRVEDGMARAERSNAPSARHVGREQCASDARCMCGMRKTTPQQMTRVRRDRRQRTLVAVERQRECAELLEPKSIDDLGAKTLGLDAKTDRCVGVSCTIEQLGGSYLRVVYVALYLDEGYGRCRQ